MYGPFLQPRGPRAARLRQRKADLLALFPIPAGLLPGSLAESHMRRGKPGCHRADPKDPGHSFWTLTDMVQAKQRTLHIPKELVEEVRLRVQTGREFQDALREILAANAELLKLSRQQKRSLP